MPHQCTECGYTFPDGSKEMLAGCPECEGNTFQYHPDAVPDDPGDAPPPEREDAGVSSAVGRAAETVRDVFGGDRSDDARSSPGQDPVTPNRAPAAEDAESEPDTASDSGPPNRDSGPEDPAQADARSEVVDAADLPAADTDADTEEREAESGADAAPAPDEDAAPPPEGSGEVVSAPDENPPGLADLREELNDQFESIRIVEPGQYELNLMELYDREEYIIALQENGRYVIEVPDAWRGDSEV